jgi:hypothetical protein
VFKIRGKILGKNDYSVITLNNGELEGDSLLISLVKNLSTEYEAYGVVPVLNYTPETDEFWKDERALFYMVGQLCTDVQVNKQLEPFPNEEGVEY